MPDESLISEIENTLSQIVSLGGQNEQSKMVPNLTVQVADPAGLDGFVIVSDNRDGDNILAKKVGSVIYSDNDLVNVMFVEGGEAIAFQQGSESPNGGGIWEIVPSTSTDIFYDKGDVGIGKSVAPDAALEVLDTAQAQLRLTHTEDTKFVDFMLDTNHDLTIKPSSTGQVIFQPTTDSTDFFQILDADGGTPALNVDSTNERVGIGASTPGTKLNVIDEDAVTNTTTDIITLGHNSTGTPAANFGAGLLYQLESSTTADQDAAQIAALWTTATHATRASALTFQTLTNGGALTEQMRIAGDGVITSVSGRIKNTTRITDADSPYTVLATDEIIVADTDGGVIAVNLPAGVDGTHYRITNVGTAANDVTVDPNGAEELFGGGAGVSFALVDSETINIYYETTEGWW